MRRQRSGFWVLGSASGFLRSAFLSVLLVAACKPEADQPSAWEIVRGTASLAASRSLNPARDTVLAEFLSRTGSLTVADDSTVTGWIKLASGDTVHFTAGTVADDGGLVMTLPGLTPSEYSILTDGNFPNTYGLLSTSAVTGGDHPSLHLVYWEFDR